MWEMHLRCLDLAKIEEPLYVNITGGLDSRVIAGVLKHQGYKIANGCFFYNIANCHNVPHVKKLVNILKYDNFEFKDSKTMGTVEDWGEPTEEMLKSTYVNNVYGDIATGSSLNKKKIRKYLQWVIKNKIKYGDLRNHFKRVIDPFDNSIYIGFMFNLPKYLRVYQRGYMLMIRKYLPNLYEIPRCFEKNQEPIDLNYYIPKRIISKIKRRIFNGHNKKTRL